MAGPTCATTFVVKGVDFTRPGENVIILGEQPELGHWAARFGLVLSGQSFPTWRGTFDLPQGLALEYKAAVLGPSALLFETGDNRTAMVPTGKDCATTIEIDFRRP
jgi:alpha-amylase